MTSPLHIAVIGAFDPAYTRHAVILGGLESQGVRVTRFQIPKTAPFSARAWHLLRSFCHAGGSRCDLVLVPAFNQTTAPLAWLLGKLTRTPVLLDYMIGLSDPLEDRGAPAKWRTALYRAIDRFNLRCVPCFTDTVGHIGEFRRLLGIDVEHLARVPVGARLEFFQAELPPPPPETFILQFWGSFIPFHGVEVILEAADRLRVYSEIRFEFFGNGQTHAKMTALAQDLHLDNVTFDTQFYRPPEIFKEMGRAAAFLGVFGDQAKTNYVVPFKVVESMALGRPVITGKSSAISDAFYDGVEIISIASNDAEKLSQAIRLLYQNRDAARAIGAAGRKKIETYHHPSYIGALIIEEAWKNWPTLPGRNCSRNAE